MDCFGTSSLVDGNVTVGGGKATPTKTYRHGRFERTQFKMCKQLGRADRRFNSPRVASGYKKRESKRVHVRFATLIKETLRRFGEQGKN